MNEPSIVVNGIGLSTGQAMAIRVAVSDFREQMTDPIALGPDAQGRALANAYRERLTEVLQIMLEES